jgi:hypothetical protein
MALIALRRMLYAKDVSASCVVQEGLLRRVEQALPADSGSR